MTGNGYIFASCISCVAMWSFLSLVTNATIQHAQFLSPHSCRYFVINCWYAGSQAWYCSAKYLTIPLKQLFRPRKISNCHCLHKLNLYNTYKLSICSLNNTAWQRATVITSQQEKMSLLAEKSWHLDSIFFQRQLNHTVQWIISGTFWNHKPQNICKETNKIKQEKIDFLKETQSGQSCSFQVLLSGKFQYSLHFSKYIFLLNSLYFLFCSFEWLTCATRSYSWLHFFYPQEVGKVGIAKSGWSLITMFK